MKPADVKSSTCIDDAFENNNKHPKCEVYYGTKLTSQYGAPMTILHEFGYA